MMSRKSAWMLVVFVMIQAYGDFDRLGDGLTWFGWRWFLHSVAACLLVVAALNLWHYKVMDGGAK